MLAIDHQLRRDELDLVDQSRPHDAAKCVAVERAAQGERLRQIGVPDESRTCLRERRIAEQVIGMRMAVDHIADGFGGQRPDGGEQPRAFAHAAAGIDHGDQVLSDDDTDVGDVALVLRGHQRGFPEVHVDARGNFAQRELIIGARRAGKR